MLAEAIYYSRMALGLAAYHLTPQQKDPIAPLLDQMEHREERFLMVARHALSRPQGLYRKVFDAAGCSYADLEAAVRKNGLQRAMESLLDAGVCIRHDEFRGKTPIVRGGRRIDWKAADWDSPWGRGMIEHSTSGSTGKRFTTSFGRRFILHREGYELLHARQFDLRSRPRVMIGTILPSAWPLRYAVMYSRLRIPFDHWFALSVDASHLWHYKTATQFMVGELRLLGASVPRPEYLPENDFTPVARLLARCREQGRPAFVLANVSPATRIAAAARDQGLDIGGTLFTVAGEPLSDAKRGLIESAGAAVFPAYLSTEFGAIGYACRQMTTGNCVHLFNDALLLASRRQDGAPYGSLYATSLLPWSPRILINVEVDDCATIEKTTCDCEYARLGFDLQVRDIFSYGKVTAQGITVEAGDLIQVLEEALPARFGGAPGDYQLAEVEGSSQTEVVLRISPRTGITSLEPVTAFFLEQLGRLYGGSLSARMWSFTGGLRVAIEEPEITITGKVHPLRLRGAGTSTATAPP